MKRRSKQARKMREALTSVNRKRLIFLREVSEILSDSLGFEVKVSLVKAKMASNVAMRRGERLTKKAARLYYQEVAMAPSLNMDVEEP